MHRHPTVKMLALSFLLLIGLSLLAEGFDHHIPKGYIYFAMGFSVFVEAINLRIRPKAAPVHLHEAYVSRSRVKTHSGRGRTPEEHRTDLHGDFDCGGARSLRATFRTGASEGFSAAALARSAQAPLGPNQWLIDAGHSAASFSVRHLMVVDRARPARADDRHSRIRRQGRATIKADVTIDVKAINTQNTRSATAIFAAPTSSTPPNTRPSRSSPSASSREPAARSN